MSKAKPQHTLDLTMQSLPWISHGLFNCRKPRPFHFRSTAWQRLSQNTISDFIFKKVSGHKDVCSLSSVKWLNKTTTALARVSSIIKSHDDASEWMYLFRQKNRACWNVRWHYKNSPDIAICKIHCIFYNSKLILWLIAKSILQLYFKYIFQLVLMKIIIININRLYY